MLDLTPEQQAVFDELSDGGWETTDDLMRRAQILPIEALEQLRDDIHRRRDEAIEQLRDAGKQLVGIFGVPSLVDAHHRYRMREDERSELWPV